MTPPPDPVTEPQATADPIAPDDEATSTPGPAAREEGETPDAAPEAVPDREPGASGAPPPGRIARSWRRLGPRSLGALGLLAAIAVAWLLPATSLLTLGGGPSSQAGDDLHVAIGALPDQPLVLVDMDPDLGTYPEIRYATRAAFADLFAVGARVAVISFSPEGRAIAVAEIARLRAAGAGPDRLVDLGFRSGGEAALVQLAGGGIGREASGSATGTLADLLQHGGDLGVFDLALVVGGGEMSPRTWIEQVEPRAPGLAVAAITPSFLLPEMQPYRDAGQLLALVGTLRAGVAYGDAVAAGGASSGLGQVPPGAPNALAMLVGMLIALAFLLESGASRLVSGARASVRRLRS